MEKQIIKMDSLSLDPNIRAELLSTNEQIKKSGTVEINMYRKLHR